MLQDDPGADEAIRRAVTAGYSLVRQWFETYPNDTTDESIIGFWAWVRQRAVEESDEKARCLLTAAEEPSGYLLFAGHLARGESLT